MRNLIGLLVAAAVCIAPAAAQQNERDTVSDHGIVDEYTRPFYFALLVSDVDTVSQWYQRTFGLTTLDDTVADDGSWRIVNLRSDELFVEIIRDDRAVGVDRAHGIRKVGFGVSDIDAVADRVELATGSRPRVITFEQHDVRILQLRDPEGNTVQLLAPADR